MDSRQISTARKELVLFLLLSIGCYVLTAGWNLGGQTISNPDEPRYACAAREMLRTGNWLVPQFNGHDRLEKPILFYWVIAATGKAGQMLGLSLATGMRVGPFLMGLLAVIATFLIARRLTRFDARAGFVAAVVLMTCNQFHKVSREIVTDMTLTACVAWAWYFVLVALDKIRAQANAFFPLLGFYVCLGLICMAKGPLPVAGFVVLPLLLYLFATRSLRDLLRAGVWWGAPLSVIIGFWWFYALGKTGHEEGVSQFFFVENFKRIFGAKDHIHEWPWLYYFQIWPEGLLPWIAALPILGWWSFESLKTGVTRVSSNAALFALCALLGGFAIIGVSQSKRALYLLPLYPAFAIWLSLNWKQAVEPISARAKAGWIVLSVALVLALAYEVVVTPIRERSEDRVAFFEDIDKQLKGRTLATYGASANEAIWFLDRKEPILNLTATTLKEKFFETKDTVLLLKASDLGTTSALKPALKIEFQRKRGTDKHGKDELYFLATPDPAHPPDEKVFERRTKDTAKDTGED